MKKLSAAKVYRAGRTARYSTQEPTRVALSVKEGAISFKFSLNSKGGGITEVTLSIGFADFPDVLNAMVGADRVGMTRTIAGALASELAKQPEYDRVTARKARGSVVDAARRAYDEAPEGRDHAEKLNLDMVERLVEELDKLDAAGSTEDSDAA